MDMARILAEKRRWLVAFNQLSHDDVPHSTALILFLRTFRYRTPEQRITVCDADAEPSKVK